MKLFADLYLDEDVSVLLSDLLQGKGFDVLTARDAHMLGQDDPQQLSRSAKEGRAILTHNRAHFEKLHAEWLTSQRKHFGIIIATRRDIYELARRAATC